MKRACLLNANTDENSQRVPSDLEKTNYLRMKSLILTVKSSVLPMYFVISIVWMITMSCKAGNDSTYKKIPLTAQERQLIANSNTFGLDLFRAVNVAEADTSNLMISPVSVALALGMTTMAPMAQPKPPWNRLCGCRDLPIPKSTRLTVN